MNADGRSIDLRHLHSCLCALRAVAPSWTSVDGNWIEVAETNLLKSLDYSVLQQCMHCGMCLPTCPTYDETKFERSSPRGRIRLMREVADGRLDVTATFAEEMSYCLGCLACQTACPAGVDYATLLENARGEVERRGVVGGPWRRFVRWFTLSVLFRHPRLLRAVGRALWLYQRSGVQSGDARGRRSCGILPAAAAAAGGDDADGAAAVFATRASAARDGPSDGEVPRRAAHRLRAGFALRRTSTGRRPTCCWPTAARWSRRRVQFCCGSLHAHNGELELARDLARQNLDLFDLDAARRRDHQRRRLRVAPQEVRGAAARRPGVPRARRTRGIARCGTSTSGWWRLASAPPRAVTARRARRPSTIVTYDASCHLLHGQKIAAPAAGRAASDPRRAARRPRPSPTGAAAAPASTASRSPSSRRSCSPRKLDHIARPAPAVLASGNPGCLLQLEQGMRRDARLQHVRVCHPVELLAEAYRRERPALPATESRR